VSVPQPPRVAEVRFDDWLLLFWKAVAPLDSPVFVTPTLGVATATTINKVTITAPASGSTLTIADGKTLTVSNTVTVTAMDGATLTVGGGGAGTTYTPSLTNVTNVNSSSSATCHYIRLGNQVMVSGLITVDPTAGAPTLTEIDVSLPIASNLAALADLVGTGNREATSGWEQVQIVGDTTNDRARLVFLATDTNLQKLAFNFMYTII